MTDKYTSSNPNPIRINEFICRECDGVLNAEYHCSACNLKFDLMTRVHFDLDPDTLMTTMWAIRDEVDKVLESQGLKFSYGEGYAPGYEVGWHGWLTDEDPIHEVMKKWNVDDYTINTDHDELE